MTYITFYVQCGSYHYYVRWENTMGASIIGRIAGSVKALSAVMGVAAAVAMSVMCFSHGSAAAGFSVARNDDPTLATVTRSTAPRELATSFARPTHTATPCAPRATMPC